MKCNLECCKGLATYSYEGLNLEGIDNNPSKDM